MVDSKPDIEPLVEAERIAEHIGFCAETVRRMARRGEIPAVPFQRGSKTFFRFRLSEVDSALKSELLAPSLQGEGAPTPGSKKTGRRPK